MKVDNAVNNLAANHMMTTLTKNQDTKDFNQELEKALQAKDDKKLYDACVELESVFINKVFDAMRSSISRSDLVPRGFATEAFESMLYDEYAKEISKSKTMGISEILYNQLKNR